jgi:hypothetical protein
MDIEGLKRHLENTPIDQLREEWQEILAQQKEIEQLKDDSERWANELNLQISFLDIERRRNKKLKEELSNYTRTDIKP